MLNLLRIEWLKIKNYTAFKLLLIFFTAGIFLSNYIVKLVISNMIDNTAAGKMIPGFDPYSFEHTWQSTSYTTGFLLILPAMIMLILVTNEYTFRTNRQNIIDGWSRYEFVNVKLLLAFILALLSTVLVFFTALGFGFASGTTFAFTGFAHIGYFFLKALSYNMVAVLMAILVKKTGFAIGLYFIYLGAENILSGLLETFGKKLTNNVNLGNMGDYLPMSASDGLLTFPDSTIKSFVEGALPTNYTWVVFAFAIAYLILFIVWSRAKYLKADL
jgi:ABC-2 type transport system permease protein